MLDPLQTTLRIAGSGVEAQSARLRIIAENLANSQSTGSTPGADPYSRKTITFAAQVDRTIGSPTVRVSGIGTDRTAFRIEHDPGNPAADADGNVKLPNVDMLVETADMREANRGYQANLMVTKQARELFSMTLDLLKA